VEEQPVQEALEPLEAAVYFIPTLAEQVLIIFSTVAWPQWGHSTSGSEPKTSFSKSWAQLLQRNSKMGIMKHLLDDHD
jgi:hypothetical protein